MEGIDNTINLIVDEKSYLLWLGPNVTDTGSTTDVYEIVFSKLDAFFPPNTINYSRDTYFARLKTISE